MAADQALVPAPPPGFQVDGAASLPPGFVLDNSITAANSPTLKAYVQGKERAAATPTGSFLENATAGLGMLVDKGARGLEERIKTLGNRTSVMGSQLVSDADLAAVRQRNEDLKKTDKPLEDTWGGMIGEAGGAAALTGGASTIKQAAAMNGALGFLQPVGTTGSVAENTALAAGLGAGGKFAGDKIGAALGAKLTSKTAALKAEEAQNAGRDLTLKTGRDAGYVVPPSQANPSLLNQAAEGFSGKIKTGQAASAKNQGVTNDLTRQALGLPKDSPLNLKVLEDLRNKAGQAYAAIKAIPGNFKTDAQFGTDVAAIGNDFAAAAKEFPEIAKTASIETLQTALTRPEMSPNGAMELVRKLRFDASKNFKAFDDPEKASLGAAQKKAADAIENLIERNLAAQGKGDLVDSFKQARTLIAKSYDVEAALNENTGNVSAKVLARALDKGRPLTGNLKTVAAFADAFPKATQEVDKIGSTLGLSPLDYLAAGGMGAAGAGPTALAGLLARPAVRSVILSKPYQAMAASPSYAPGRLLQLSEGAANNPLLRRLAPGAATDGALQSRN